MSGALCGVTGGAASPSPPFVVTVGLTGGVTYNVSTSSGDLATLFGSIIGLSGGGGTPPYSITDDIAVDSLPASASLLKNAAPGDALHETLYFSGLNSLGDTIAFYLTATGTDSGGQNASARFPNSGDVAIKRV